MHVACRDQQRGPFLGGWRCHVEPDQGEHPLKGGLDSEAHLRHGQQACIPHCTVWILPEGQVVQQ